MKLLVLGCGSIGTRHARNARADRHEIILCDADRPRAANLAVLVEGTVADNFDAALAQRPDAVLICTPPSLHVSPAIECAKARLPLFVEKPLSHTMEGIKELIAAVEEAKIPNMVACNLRFTEGLSKVRSLIPTLGPLKSAEVTFGFDLRRWRPGQDYRQNYAARRDQGGGIVLDAIHELDYALWLFGSPSRWTSTVRRSGKLEIETEDEANFMIATERCPDLRIHLDYLNSTYTRGCSIRGDSGTLTWDFASGRVEILSHQENRIYPTNAETNAMYVEELRYFLKTIDHATPPTNPITEAARTLAFALELRRAGEGR